MGAKLVRFTVQAFPLTRVIGKTVQVRIDCGLYDTTIEELWELMTKDGSLDALQALACQTTPNPDTVGWMGDWQPGAESYTYLAGMLFHADTPVPDGLSARDIAACEMAVGWIEEIEGEEGGDVHAQASAHLASAMREHGYEYDGSHGGFEIEYYSYERFHLAEQRGERVILDFYSPCKKRSQLMT